MWNPLALLRRRRRTEADFTEEIHAHIALEAGRLVAAGWSPHAAGLEARRQFGNVGSAQESFHDRRALIWLDDLARDMRYAFRTLRAERGFAVVAVSVLALGIAANTALFTIYDNMVLRPLPVPSSSDMLEVTQTTRDGGSNRPLSYAQYAFVRDNAKNFVGIAASAPSHLRMTGAPAAATPTADAGGVFGFTGPRQLQGSAEPVLGLFVSANYFTSWQVRPGLGRDFSDQTDDGGSAPYPVLLSENFWRRRFGGNPAVIGTAISFSGTPTIVVGITPRDFMGTRTQVPDVWLPLGAELPTQQRLADPNLLCCDIDARARAGVSLSTARAELAGLVAGMHRQYPTIDQQSTLNAVVAKPRGAKRHDKLQLAFAFFQPAVALVLLIACANVAGLLLGRAARRRREITVRLAIGASRSRIVRQLLTESVLLAAAAAVLGTVLSWWFLTLATRLYQSSVLTSGLSDGGTTVFHTTPNIRILIYAIGLVLTTGVAFGLLPALQTTRVDLTAGLQSGTGGATRTRTRGLTVALQIAVCLTLLIGAGSLVRLSLRMLSTDPGFQTRSVTSVSVLDPAELGYDRTHAASLERRVDAGLRDLPGLSVARTSRVPLSGNITATAVRRRSSSADSSAAIGAVPFTAVSANYFSTLGMALRRGRTFSASEIAGTGAVVIVSEQLARQLFPNEDPIGKLVTIGSRAQIRARSLGVAYSEASEVVGVVPDIYSSTITERDPSALYLPLADSAWNGQYLVRSAGDPRAVAPMITAAMRTLDRDLPVTVQTLDSVMATEGTYIGTRAMGLIFAVVGAIGLFMATVGVYSMVSAAVAQQRRELGIRIALGALARDVVSLVLRRHLRPIAAGIGMGLVLGAAGVKIMSAVFGGLGLLDVLTAVLVASALAVIALAAAYVPARRATRLDPALTLRLD